MALLVVLTVPVANAVEQTKDFTPYAGLSLDYTTNLNQDDKNTSAFVSGITAGARAELKGGNTDLDLNYSATQYFYSDDQRADKFNQTLSFNAKRALNKRGLSMNASASIRNEARASNQNAAADTISGGTFESRSASLGLEYRTNPRSYVNLDARVDGSIGDNEGSIDDYRRVNADVTFRDGTKTKLFFWSGSYDAERTFGDESNGTTTSQYFQSVFGLQTQPLRPLVRFYYEDYDDTDATTSNDGASIGPGLRYYLSYRTWAEVAYNFALNNDEDDYWSARVNWQPSRKTRLTASYEKRIFGDSYGLSYSHQSHRTRTTVRYTETVSSFDDEFVFNGEINQRLTVDRRLTWETRLQQRRSEWQLTLTGSDLEPVTKTLLSVETKRYGAGIGVSHQLSSLVEGSAKVNFDRYEFSSPLFTTQQDDYYKAEVNLSKRFNDSATGTAGLRYLTRVAGSSSREFDEFRFQLNGRIEF